MIIFIYDEKEQSVFAYIYDEHGGRMLSVAEYYLSATDAEDALHDVFEKLLGKFEKDFEKLCDNSPYFFVKIMENHCKDVLRKSKLRSAAIELTDDESVFIDFGESPEELLHGREDREALSALIKLLRPNYRQVLELRYFMGYTNTEIAEELGVSVSVVSTRINRARNALKKIIERRGDKL